MKTLTSVLFLLFIVITSLAQQTGVGAMGGSFAVSDMGAATYTIPIEMPQGIDGMQPNIALVYNSQCGNGVCGLGFSISGQSTITRVPRTIHYDGTAKGIKYNATDAYALNGQRLLLVSGSEGKDGAKYGLEGDMQTEVILHGSDSKSNDGTDQWWEVKSGGMTMKYGSTKEGKVLANSCTAIWYLDYATDLKGNVIEYIYSPNISKRKKILPAYPYLIAIQYGGNSLKQLSHIHKVQFEYESRTDILPTIIAGCKGGAISYRLKTITSSTNSTILRKYNLNYTVVNGLSKLTSVKEQGSNNEYLPTTSFSWNNDQNINTTNISFSNACSKPVDEQFFMADDVTGDGKSNLLAISNESSNKQTIYAYDVKNGSTSLLYKTDIPRSGTFNKGVVTMTSPSAYTSADITGDGINNIVVPTVTSETAIIPISSNQFLPVTMAYSSINFIVCSKAVNQNYTITANLNKQKTAPIYGIGDFFGKGISSIVYLETTSINGKYHIGYNTPKTKNFDKGLDVALPQPPQKLFCSDFNGDGLSDMLITYKGGYAIAWNQDNGLFSESKTVKYSEWGNFDVMRMGDFNGDDFADFVCNNRNSNDIVILTSNGNGSFSKSTAINTLEIADHGFTDRDNDKFSINVLDFNGDGKNDVIITKSAYDKKHDISGSWGKFKKTYTYWLQSDDSKLTLIKTASSNKAEDGICSRFVTGDFDGDGQIELMNYGYDCYTTTNANVNPQWHIYNFEESVSKNKITEIRGDYERLISLSYSSLSNANVYSKSNLQVGAAFPTTIPLHVVSSTTVDNGAAGAQSTNYKYKDLYIMKQGKGILGFCCTTANYTTLGSSSSLEIGGWNSTYYIPTMVTTTQKSGNSTATSVTRLSITAKGGKRYFAYPINTEETDIYGNKTITANTYNTTNYTLANQKKTYNDGSYVSTEYSYTKAGGMYKPTKITTSKKYAKDSYIFSTTDTYAYNTATGNLTSHIENAGKAEAITHSYKYDDFGNVISKQTTWEGGATPTTNYTYDASKRFIIRAKQAGLSDIEYTRDIFGNVLTETDATDAANKLSTQYTYDGFGRLTSSIDCFGIKTTYTRTKLSAKNRYYSLCTTTEGRAPITTYFDNNGREVESETIGERGIKISSTKSYTKFGTVSSEINKNGDIIMSQSHNYDNLGRHYSKTGTTTPYTTYSYSNRKVVVKDNNNNRNSTITYDALGNIKTISDDESSISYTYDACGKPAKITSSGASYSIKYDDLGRQISLSDPDAGTTNYTYDALGRIVGSTNARGVKTTNTYDAYGNLTKNTCGTVTTTYTYGTTDATRCLLQSESNGSQTIQYTYDKYHRLASKKYIIDGESFTYNYAYDLNNRLSYVQTPLGNEEYVYDSYDNIIEIKFAGQTVWKLVSYSGKNRQTTLGNTMNLLRTTTQYGLPESQSFTHVNTGVIYNKQTYTFGSKSGNLEKRSGVNSATETFTYDSADRLINVNKGNSSATTITYAPNGNITSKSNVGTYSYSGSKPHAVISVIDSTKTPSVETQNIKYTPFNKVESIKQNDLTLAITYGPDQQRVKTIYSNKNIKQTRIYAGDFERLSQNGSTISYLYIYSPDGLVGIYVKPSNGTAEMHYAVTDHLGSLLALYKGNLTKTYEASYDAWGKQTISKNTINLRRGYCLHEHWNEFDLIDMNGRFYDPVLGRFISPDPYVQDMTNPQNFNRYSYCLNNPLKYTDPSGEFWHIVIGAVIGGVANWITHGCKLNAKGLGYFGIGALAGAASAATCGGISSAMAGTGFAAGFAGSATAATATSCFASGALIGGAGGVISGSVTGFGNTLLDGGNLGQAIGQLHLQSLIGGVSGAVVGGIAGGIQSVRDGENFWYGCRKEVVEDYSLPNGGLKIHKQSDRTVGCTQEVMYSVAEYKGEPLDPNALDMTIGMDAKQAAEDLGFRSSRTISDFSESNIDLIGRNLNAGNPTVLTYNNGGTYHTVGVQRITVYSRTTIFGSVKTSYRIQVMNPLSTKYQTFSSFRHGFARIIM